MHITYVREFLSVMKEKNPKENPLKLVTLLRTYRSLHQVTPRTQSFTLSVEVRHIKPTLQITAREREVFPHTEAAGERRESHRLNHRPERRLRGFGLSRLTAAVAERRPI